MSHTIPACPHWKPPLANPSWTGSRQGAVGTELVGVVDFENCIIRSPGPTCQAVLCQDMSAEVWRRLINSGSAQPVRTAASNDGWQHMVVSACSRQPFVPRACAKSMCQEDKPRTNTSNQFS